MPRDNRIYIRRLILSGLFLAIGMVLPLITMQIKEIGDSLLPMHLPVLLCGLICGWKYGGTVGLMMPFLRSAFFGMPPLYPNAVWMALELAVYGFVIGFVYFKFGKRRLRDVYISLLIAMIAGRIVWGIAKAILLGGAGNMFTVQMFLVGGFLDAIPGIVLQLVLIPAIMLAFNKMRKGTMES